MGDELIKLEEQSEKQAELQDVLEGEIATGIEEHSLTTEESELIADTEDVEEIEVVINETVGWSSGDASDHSHLAGRDRENQHPIEAITGLRHELNEIEALQPVYSNKIGIANYYKWDKGTSDKTGYFVRLASSVPTVSICNGPDIFGVTVDSAGFIGGQDGVTLEYVNGEVGAHGAERDNHYALVATSGLVDVRCESDVEQGDYVVSNAYGEATKTDSDCGYKVMAMENKNGINYAIIALGVQACTADMIGKNLKHLETRVSGNEINIAFAMTMANEAYNKASECLISNGELNDKVSDSMDKVDNIESDVENMGAQVGNIAIISAKTKAIAESAALAADSIRVEAVEKANEALAETSKLRDELNKTAEDMNENLNDAILDIEALQEDLEPLSAWPDADNPKGIAGFVARVNEDSATLASIVAWKGDSGESLAAFVQEATGENATVKAIAQYQRLDENNNPIGEPGAAGLIAQVEANKSSIELIAKLDGDIAGIKGQVDANTAELSHIVNHKYKDATGLAAIDQQITEQEASINNLVSWQSNTNVSMARIEQKADANGAHIQSTVVNIDKYNVGPYSQAQGFTLEQAKNVLEPGMIYVPTVSHDGETYNESYEFTRMYTYTWTEDGIWDESIGEVVFFGSAPGGTAYSLWYKDGGDNSDGYEPDTLYKLEEYYEDDEMLMRWVAVATLHGNVSNRTVSQIRQDANSIIAEVTNVYGAVAEFGAKLSDTDAKVNSIVSWPIDGGTHNMAVLESKVDDNGAYMVLAAVTEVDGESKVKDLGGAKIVLSDSEDGSFIQIDADNIVLGGTTTFTTKDELDGTTKIHGGHIAANTITATQIATDALQSNNYESGVDGSLIPTDKYSTLGTFFDLSNGSIYAPYFHLNEDGKIFAKGGEIGGFTITSGSIYHTKYHLDYSVDGVYIGPNGIGLGSAFKVKADGSLMATGVDITGKITATSGYIGSATSGFAIDSSSITNGTIGDLGSICLSAANIPVHL